MPRTILGAHIIGPQAVNLLQPLLQAMTLGQSVDQLAHHVLYVHPTLTEVLEQAYSICELITRYALVAGFSSTIFVRLTATRARREHRLQLPTVQRAKNLVCSQEGGAVLSAAELESPREPKAAERTRKPARARVR
jgi:hypothetical protein